MTRAFSPGRIKRVAKRRAEAKGFNRNHWRTPDAILERVRQTFGGQIDLDVCTDPGAQKRVQALRHFAPPIDALTQKWQGRVFCNPPGDLYRAFWRKLCSEHRVGRAREFVWIGYSINHLRMLQKESEFRDKDMQDLELAMCVPKKRIQFLDTDNKPGDSPAQDNCIIYGGSAYERFYQAFSDLGRIWA